MLVILKTKKISLFPSNAFERYSERCKQNKILPVKLGLNTGQLQSKEINSNDYLMGEKYLDAFNQALATSPHIEWLNMSNNRLGGNAAKSLLRTTDDMKTDTTVTDAELFNFESTAH